MFKVGDIITCNTENIYNPRDWWEVITKEEYKKKYPNHTIDWETYLPVKKAGKSSPFSALGTITWGTMSLAILVKPAVKKEISYEV